MVMCSGALVSAQAEATPMALSSCCGDRGRGGSTSRGRLECGAVEVRRASPLAMTRPRPAQLMAMTPLQSKEEPKEVLPADEAMRIERRWQEFFSDPSQWWDNTLDKKSPRSPDFRHKRTKEVLWIEGWSNPPWVKTELMIQGRVQSGDGSHVDVQTGASSQEYSGRAEGVNQAQFLAGHQTSGMGNNSLNTTITEGREVNQKNSSGTGGGDVRTLSKAGQLKEALHILNQGGIQADSRTYVCVLQECANKKALAEGKQVHGHITQSGLKPNTYLLNTLMNMYAKCGSLVDARQVFDKISNRDMFTWNMMLTGYVKHGFGREAVKIYEQMQLEGVKPDRVTFICALNACASIGALEKGKEIHADIIKSGISPHIVLETALTDMYAKCGSVKDARQVFDNIAKRNVVSWNAMIGGYARHGCGREALEMYEEMQQEGVTPDRVTFICVVNACATLGVLEKAKEVHSNIIKAGITRDLMVESALTDMYAKCGSLKDARRVFDSMTRRNVVSWNAMIAGYAQHGYVRQAFEIYEQMQQGGVTPDKVTFICVLNACASLGELEKGKEVHADIVKGGIAPDIILENTLVNMYAKCGSMKDALQVLDNMAKRDVISWSAMIAGYTQHGCGREALKMYEEMQQEGVTPNRVTFTSVLNACASLGDVEKGKEVHADIIRAGIVPDIIMENVFVDMYAKCGNLKDARQVLDSMVKRDVVSWSAMITGYTLHGCGREVLEVYELMQEEGLAPDRATFIHVLNACASPEVLQKVHADIVKAGITADISLETTLVNMYAKCGRVKNQHQVLENSAQ